MKKSATLVLAVIVVVILGVAGAYYSGLFAPMPAPQPEKKITKVVLQLPWTLDVTYMSAYIAKDKGWYLDEGLDVEIRPGRGGGQAVELLAAGQADVGFAAAENIIIGRSKGMPVKIIYQSYQSNPAGIAAPTGSGIKEFKDIVGRKLGVVTGVSQFYQYKALLAKYGIDEKKVEEVPMGFDVVAPLVAKKADAVLAWTSNMPDYREVGLQVDFIRFRDLGFNFPHMAIFTNDNTVQKSPEMLQKFLRATDKGVRFIIDHPGETADLLLKYAEQAYVGKKTLAFGRVLSAPELIKGDLPIGQMAAEKYVALQDFLYANKMITQKSSIDDVFTTKFLPKTS